MTSSQMFHTAAAAWFREGDFASARDACQAGLEAEPDHPGLTELLGLARYETEDLTGALHALETASVLAPLSAAAQVALADLYARFGQAMASRAIYEFLAEPGRCPTPMLPDVARGLGRHGRYGLALGVCRRLADLRPMHHPAHFAAAYYLGRLGRPPAEALPHAQAAFELAPHSTCYRFGLAAVLVRLGRAGEGYDLIRGVPPEAIPCRDCLRQILPCVEAAGDETLAGAYRDRIDRLSGQPVGDDRDGGFES